MTYSVYHFNVKEVTEECIQWVKDWFETNGKGCNAVIGMSGGKDSTIAAAICAKALGPDRVIGVAMPDDRQDVNDADEICKYLGIKYMYYPIAKITETINAHNLLRYGCVSEQTTQNIPPRVRMTVLYGIAQSFNGRPVNTCNLSEDYVGYATLFGDAAGSFSPLGKLTVTEIIAIGDYLGIPSKWVHKTPDDGLPHSSPDEVKFGFTYAELDKYIREGIVPQGNVGDETKKEKIDRMYKANKFKTDIINIPAYNPNVILYGHLDPVGEKGVQGSRSVK